MSNLYVRSTDGSNSDNGSTWTLAKATLAGAGAIDAAGDTVFVSQSHAESSASTINLSTWAGTATAPTNVICANDAAQPPTALATTATVTSTGAANMNLVSGPVYYYGITFSCGDGANNNALLIGQTNKPVRLESCKLRVPATATSFIGFGTNDNANVNEANSAVTLINCSLRFGSSASYVDAACNVTFLGGSIESGGTSPSILVKPNVPCNILFDGFDFSNLSTSAKLAAAAGSTGNQIIVFRNCKLPASWSGTLIDSSATPGRGSLFEMRNCDAGAVNYAYWRETFAGSIRHETTRVLTGTSATDGTTPLSWKMVTNGSPGTFPSGGLQTAEFCTWNESTGTALAATVEFLRDNLTGLKNDEIILDVEYLGDSGSPVASRVTTAKSTPMASGSTLASSSVTWTTTGLTNPNKQKLVSPSFTPQQKGWIIARVTLIAASTTVYLDPVMTLA